MPAAYTKVLPLDDVNGLVAGRHGYFIANKFDAYIGLGLIRYGEYAELEWDLLSRLIKPGENVAEVGASIGAHTVSLAKAVGPGAWVIAVEPQRIIHQYLCANLALNGLLNVEAHLAGCGAEPGEMTVPPVDYFARRDQNFGAVALTSDGAGEPVPVLRLDDIMRGRPAQLVKIDVEGMEAQVLTGAARLIETSRPLLYVENDRLEKSDALLSLIWSMNYRTFWHIPGLFNPANFFGDNENVFGNVASFNMLCTPREGAWSVQGLAEATRLGEHPLRPAA